LNLYDLPDIEFAERAPDAIKTDIISGYEAAHREATGERITLYPGDPRRLFLLSVAEMIIIQRSLIDWTAKQNTLAYASGPRLDHLGLMLAVSRLPARRSRATIRFALSAPQQGITVIPAGTRVTAGGGNTYFATAEPIEIPAGEISGDALALALDAGKSANGFLPGQIGKLVDPLPWVQSVENITESAGGADVEDDENFRERIHLAPESFSVAGARGAYEYWVKTAHASIIDAAIIGPPIIEPGRVEIYPLMEGGELPTRDILDLVYQTCGAEDIRPMTDYVTVHPPVPAGYSLSLRYWIHRGDATRATAIHSAVVKAVDAWILWQRSKIGRDIIPSALVQYVMEAGAKRADVSSPEFRELGYKELAIIDDPPEIIYGGLEDD
jgi:phage-related baseplate assembly protein